MSRIGDLRHETVSNPRHMIYRGVQNLYRPVQILLKRVDAYALKNLRFFAIRTNPFGGSATP
jgi:hypothetical protein